MRALTLIEIFTPVYMEASYPIGRVSRQRRDPGCYIKVLFFGSLFIWDRRATRLAEISDKRAGISARGVDNCPV